jgi:hypothetical protein
VWYKFCQNNSNVQSFDPEKPGQIIPSGGELEISITSPNAINMTPNSPPQSVQLTKDDGSIANIYLLHGTEDGDLYFGDPGKMQYGTEEEFNKWLDSKGWPHYNYVSCNGNKIVGGNAGARELINATGAVYVGTKTVTNPNGEKKQSLVFHQ